MHDDHPESADFIEKLLKIYLNVGDERFTDVKLWFKKQAGAFEADGLASKTRPQGAFQERLRRQLRQVLPRCDDFGCPLCGRRSNLLDVRREGLSCKWPQALAENERSCLAKAAIIGACFTHTGIVERGLQQ